MGFLGKKTVSVRILLVLVLEFHFAFEDEDEPKVSPAIGFKEVMAGL